MTRQTTTIPVHRRAAHVVVTILFSIAGFCPSAFGEEKPPSVSPDAALERLKAGNARFVAGKSERPRQGIERIKEVLGAKLIVVLGHTRCGAVAAACDYEKPVPGHIETLVNAIKPAAVKVRAMHLPEEERLNAAVRENVKLQTQQLRDLEPLLAKRVREGTIKIVGAIYDLDTGKVEFLP